MPLSGNRKQNLQEDSGLNQLLTCRCICQFFADHQGLPVMEYFFDSFPFVLEDFAKQLQTAMTGVPADRRENNLRVFLLRVLTTEFANRILATDWGENFLERQYTWAKEESTSATYLKFRNHFLITNHLLCRDYRNQAKEMEELKLLFEIADDFFDGLESLVPDPESLLVYPPS
jgi:hypothetical protein